MTYSKWLSLSLSTRVKIAQRLGIAKTGSTHVVNNIVESDGYKVYDVENAIAASGIDFDVLVAEAEGVIVTPKAVEPQSPMAQPIEAAEEAPKRTRTRASSKPKKKGK